MNRMTVFHKSGQVTREELNRFWPGLAALTGQLHEEIRKTGATLVGEIVPHLSITSKNPNVPLLEYMLVGIGEYTGCCGRGCCNGRPEDVDLT